MTLENYQYRKLCTGWMIEFFLETRADEGDAQDFLHSLRHGSQMGWLVDRMSEWCWCIAQVAG